jgi:hypothetical protein
MTRLLTILLVLVLNLTGLQVHGQSKFTAGGRIGLGISQLPELNQSGSIAHFAFGGTFNYSFLPFIGLSADALFVTSGGTYKGSTSIANTQGFIKDEPYDGDIRFTALSIPFYPQLSLGNDNFRILLNGGISTNFNLFASESRDYENDDNNDNVNDLVKDILEDYSVISFASIYGVGTRLKLSEGEFLQIDLRASFGLTDLYTTKNTNNPTTFTQNMYTLSASYFF